MQKMDGGAARLNGGVARPREVGIPALKSRLDEPAQAQWKSGGGNVLYKDQILPPAHKRITREQLDKQLIADAPRQDSLSLRKISHGDGKDGLTTLARCCLRIIADNIEQKKIQDALGTRIMNHRHIRNLCKRVRKRFHSRELPFSVWEALLAIDADAMPSEMKTYTGLVFDDSDELSSLNSIHNTTLLDLSNTAFQALDIYKIRMYFSNSLVALRMDHLTSVDDDAITILSRNVGQEDGKAFAKLEVLTLRGCKLITDRSAPKLARFTALKMLDLRQTSCTTATKDILRTLTKPPFISAFTPVQLSLFAKQRLDRVYQRFSHISSTPLVKDPEDLPAVVSSSDEPCILVTELTRLDSSKVIDPRLPTIKSRFKASHHVYGNVYTSVPINSETLRDDGSDAAAKGLSFQAGGKHVNVMSGHLPISQVDIAWKRFDCKRKSTSMPASEPEFEDDFGDSDLEESDTYTKQELAGHKETKQATLEEAMLTAFYQNRDELPQQTASVPELPDKDPMMLLRFFKPASVTLHATLPSHAEFVSKPAARVQRLVEEGAAIRVKKRPRTSTAETLGIPKKQPESLIPAFRKSACNSAALAGKAVPAQASLQQIAAPTSIIRKASDPSRLHFTNILSKGNAWS